jgi:hypothetical protein
MATEVSFAAESSVADDGDCMMQTMAHIQSSPLNVPGYSLLEERVPDDVIRIISSFLHFRDVQVCDCVFMRGCQVCIRKYKRCSLFNV